MRAVWLPEKAAADTEGAICMRSSGTGSAVGERVARFMMALFCKWEGWRATIWAILAVKVKSLCGVTLAMGKAEGPFAGAALNLRALKGAFLVAVLRVFPGEDAEERGVRGELLLAEAGSRSALSTRDGELVASGLLDAGPFCGDKTLCISARGTGAFCSRAVASFCSAARERSRARRSAEEMVGSISFCLANSLKSVSSIPSEGALPPPLLGLLPAGDEGAPPSLTPFTLFRRLIIEQIPFSLFFFSVFFFFSCFVSFSFL